MKILDSAAIVRVQGLDFDAGWSYGIPQQEEVCEILDDPPKLFSAQFVEVCTANLEK